MYTDAHKHSLQHICRTKTSKHRVARLDMFPRQNEEQPSIHVRCILNMFTAIKANHTRKQRMIVEQSDGVKGDKEETGRNSS